MNTFEFIFLNLCHLHQFCCIGLFQKKSTPPRRMGSFFNPPSHLDFLKHKSPPLVWICKKKDPPSRLDLLKKND